MKFITKNIDNQLRIFNSLKEAIAHAEKDETTWIAFTISDTKECVCLNKSNNEWVLSLL